MRALPRSGCVAAASIQGFYPLLSFVLLPVTEHVLEHQPNDSFSSVLNQPAEGPKTGFSMRPATRFFMNAHNKRRT